MYNQVLSTVCYNIVLLVKKFQWSVIDLNIQLAFSMFRNPTPVSGIVLQIILKSLCEFIRCEMNWSHGRELFIQHEV